MSEIKLPHKFGPYVLFDKIGQGGMAELFLARNTSGKLLVFNEQYCGYPSLFWNNTYSNRVHFMPAVQKSAHETLADNGAACS